MELDVESVRNALLPFSKTTTKKELNRLKNSSPGKDGMVTLIPRTA